MLEPKPRPVLLLAHGGLVVRNLLLGTFAERVLVERPLLAAVIDPHDPELLRRFEGRPLTLIEHETEPGRDLSTWEKLRTFRTFIYYLQIGAKGTRGVELAERLYASQNSAWGSAAASFLKGAGHLLQRAGWLGTVEAAYLRRARNWPITRRWRQILEQHWPAVVVSSMLTLAKKFHPSVDLAPLIAAHQLGIPCGTLVQSWDNLSTKMGVLPAWLDRYWSWSPRMNEEMARLYPHLPADRFRVVGSPQFDFHRLLELRRPRADYAAELGLDPARRFVLIGTGTPKALPDEHRVMLALIEQLAAAEPEVQVLLRLHPKDDGERWRELRPALERCGAVLRPTAPAQAMDAGAVVSPLDFYRDQVNDLGHAEVVINCSSTLTVDAALLDRPIVGIAYDAAPDAVFPEGRARAFSEGSHFAPLVATGGVRVVQDAGSCLDAIRAYLADRALDREGRRRLVDLVTATPDGGAGHNLAIEALYLAERAG
jgi:hypothetical protein